jgi:hypothetical protein
MTLNSKFRQFYKNIENRRVLIESLKHTKSLTQNNITVVSVCANYSFVLKQTINSWKIGFHRIIICTNYKDKSTIDLCQKHNLKCVLSPCRNYNRGRYINCGIQESLNDKSTWILSMDCDVFLPFDKLVINNINNHALYGFKHKPLSLPQFNKFKKSGELPRKKWLKPCMGPFQLFNKQHIIDNNIFYNDNFNVNRRGKGADYYFAKKFKNTTLPGFIVCYNLNNPNGIKL